VNINAVASNPLNISAPVKSSIEENIKEKPLQPKAATEPVYTEKQLANLRILNCQPNTSDRYNMNEDFNRQDDPFGNGAPLKKNECCWTCRSYDMADMTYIAARLVKNINSELLNFRQKLAREFPELSALPFELTIDENGSIKILESDLLSHREIALLTESIQEYEPLKKVITAHAKLLINFANNLKTPEGKEALSFKNFSTLVNYTNLLAYATDEFNIFGQPKTTQRMHFTDRNTINLIA
jgi:hypothetical protein